MLRKTKRAASHLIEQALNILSVWHQCDTAFLFASLNSTEYHAGFATLKVATSTSQQIDPSVLPSVIFDLNDALLPSLQIHVYTKVLATGEKCGVMM